MIPTVLVIGLVGGLLLPSRGWWVVAVNAIGWTLWLLADGVITTVRQVIANGLVVALNAGLGVVIGTAIRHRIQRGASAE